MNLLDIYEKTLTLGSIVVADDGSCNIVRSNGDKTPAVLKIKDTSKLLVLPTLSQMRRPDTDRVIFYHPFRENLTTGESDVLHHVRTAIKLRMNAVVTTLMASLIELSLDTSLHAKLKPNMMKAVTELKDIDAKTRTAFNKIIKKMMSTKFKTSFVNLYLKRGGKQNNRSFLRMGVISFPFYEDLLQATDSLYDVDLRAKDIKMFKALMEFIIPNVANAEVYSEGATEQTAPYAQALFLTAGQLYEVLNTCSDMLFGKYSYMTKVEAKEMHDDTFVDVSWLEYVRDLAPVEKEILMIPMQAGNEGRAAETPVGNGPVQLMDVATKEQPQQATSRWGSIDDQIPAPRDNTTQTNGVQVGSNGIKWNSIAKPQQPVQQVQQYVQNGYPVQQNNYPVAQTNPYQQQPVQQFQQPVNQEQMYAQQFFGTSQNAAEVSQFNPYQQQQLQQYQMQQQPQQSSLFAVAMNNQAMMAQQQQVQQFQQGYGNAQYGYQQNPYQPQPNQYQQPQVNGGYTNPSVAQFFNR